MDELKYRYIIQVHRDDSYWYARPCKNWEEVIETMDQAKNWKEGADRIWFRIFEFYKDIH